MTIPPKRLENISAVCAGNVSGQVMHNRKGWDFGGTGVDAGGRVQLGSATTVTVTVVDSTGKKFINGVTYTSSTDIAPTAAGVVGPMLVTISGSNGSSIIHWGVLK